MPFPRPPRPRFLGHVRWRRLVTAALGVIVLLAVSYLIVVNVLLRTRLLRNALSADPMALRLDYQSAYSIVPGRVHVEGLTIRGRERTEEWYLTIDRADFAVSLVGLLHRTFHVTRIRASGFSLRARLRLERGAASPDFIAALPPIAGFPDPPLLDYGPEPPPLTDANYNLWSVHLEDVDVEHVRELWIQTIRSVGDTRVRGRWFFRPVRWLDVGPATVTANGVDFFYGRHPLVTGLHGSFEATVHPFDVQNTDVPAVIGYFSCKGQVGGRAIIASALRLLAPRSGVGFQRWEGPFDARVVLDHGKLAQGTQVRAEAKDTEVDAKGLAFHAPVRTEFGVAGDLATVRARVSGLGVSHRGVEQARVRSIAAKVTSRRLELEHLFDDARFTLDVSGAETDDLAAWQHFLPSTSDLVVRSGKVTADGHADGSLAQGRGRARLRLVAQQVTVARGQDQFTADFTSDAEALDVSLPGKWAVGAATVAAKEVLVRRGRGMLAGQLALHVALRRGSWATRTLDVSGSKLTVRGLSARAAHGGAPIVVVPSLSAVAQRFTVAPSGLDGQISMDLPRAEVTDFGRLGEVFALPTGFGIKAGTGRVRGHADLELGSGAMRGDGEVVARGVRARVGSTQFFGDVACGVTARRRGGAGSSTDLSGSTVAVTHAGTGNAALSRGTWWGNLALREATLRSSPSVRFDAKAHLTAKDASPATVLVAQNTGVPRWAANVFRMPVLGADAEVRFSRSSVEVRSFIARGGGTSLRAEYAKRGGRQDGAVLMDLGWIDLGYDLAEGATGLVLIGPQAWFNRKTGALRDAAVAAQRKTDGAEQLARYARMTPALRRDEARTLAARCRLEVHSCDGASIENLLRTADDAGERDTLSGITYAPMVAAAARGGSDGTALDPLVIGPLAEVLKSGGESTLDHLPATGPVAAASDSDAARGRVIAVTGRIASIRRQGPYSVGWLTTATEPVYFVTPFATQGIPQTSAQFRGVFVQRYSSATQPRGQPPSLVLVGAFGPSKSGVDGGSRRG